MGKKIVAQYVDDYDGKDVAEKDAITVRLTKEIVSGEGTGGRWSIILRTTSDRALDKALDPFVRNAEVLTAPAASGSKRDPDLTALREWWRSLTRAQLAAVGATVEGWGKPLPDPPEGDRRIPAPVTAAWEAHKAQQAAQGANADAG